MMPFLMQRPVEINEASATSEVQHDSTIALENGNVKLTLGNAGFIGCRVRVIGAMQDGTGYVEYTAASGAKQTRNIMADNERMRFAEMGMNAGNALEDKLPFKIVLMNPDGGAPQPHAHIMEKGRSGKEVGAFIITPNPPRTIKDLIPYTVGKHKGLVNVPDKWKEMIVKWAPCQSYRDPLRTNWERLAFVFEDNAYMTRVDL